MPNRNIRELLTKVVTSTPKSMEELQASVERIRKMEEASASIRVTREK